MRKFSLVLSVIMLLGIISAPLPASAEKGNILYFAEDFENVRTGVVQTMGYTQEDNDIRIEEEADGNHAMVMSVLGTREFRFERSSSTYNIYGKLVFDFDIKLQNIKDSSFAFTIRDKTFSGITLFSIDQSRNLTSGEGISLMSLSEGVYYNMTAAVNLESRKYSLFVDGVTVINQAPINHSGLGEVGYMHFRVTGIKEGSRSRYFIDNYKVYNGTEKLTKEEFENTKFHLETQYNSFFSRQMVGEYMKGKLGFYVGAEKALNGTDVEAIDSAPYIDGDTTFVPLRYITEALGGKVTYNAWNNIADITIGNKNIRISLGADEMTVNGEPYPLQKPAQIKNDRFMVPLRNMGEAVGKKVYWDRCGLIILGDTEETINWYDDPYLMNAIIGDMVYKRPSAKEIMAKVRENFPDNEHPRLLATEKDFQKIREDVNSSPQLAKWYADIIAKADAMLEEPLVDVKTASFTYGVKDKLELIMDSCLMAYMISGDTRYADRVLADVMNFVTIDKIVIDGMLQVARYIIDIAITYDWLYDYMTPQQRQTIRDHVFEKYYPTHFEDYYRDYYDTIQKRSYKWAEATMGDNWNVDCNNASLFSAIAFFDEQGEETCEKLIDEGLASIEKVFNMLAPDGAWYEGPAYWTATSDGMAFTINLFETLIGDDLGFSKVPGYDNAGYYLAYMRGEDYGLFNIGMAADFNEWNPYQAVLASEPFYARVYNNPALLTEYITVKKNKEAPGEWTDLLWVRKEDIKEDIKEELPLDAYFAATEAVTMRNTWAQDDTMFYAGIHSGQNNCPNGQLDAGSFVIDAYGTRFISELGTEHYGVNLYYTAYRNRAEGNNCIIINPNLDWHDQNYNAYTIFERFESNDISSLAVTDLSETYEGWAKSAARGMKMTNHRTCVVVQDEFQLLEPSEVYWGAHTRANVTIIDDKTAILERDGLKMEAKILSEQGTFSTMVAGPMPGKTQELPNESANHGVTKLTIYFDKVQNFDLAVCFTPLSNVDGVEIKYPEIKPLSQWTLDDAETTPKTYVPTGKDLALSEILIDGVPMENFDGARNIFNYVLEQRTSPMPTVSATLPGGSVRVEYPSEWPAPIKLHIEKDGIRGVKTINFEKPPIYTDETTHDSVKIVGAECPGGYSEEDDYFEWSYDGDYDTSFACSADASTPNYVIYDVGEVKPLDLIGIAFYIGAERKTFIDIEVSEDKVNWTRVFEGESSGATNELEYFELFNTPARYVKVIGHGTNQVGSPWLNLVEVKILEKKAHMLYNPFAADGAEDRVILGANDGESLTDLAIKSAPVSSGSVISAYVLADDKTKNVANAVFN